MQRRWIAPLCAAVCLGAAAAAPGQQLPTLDEALEISKSTGRPILAMAGQET